MDEREWQTSTDWLSMWHTMEWGEAFDRKRRLIATGACRQFLHLFSDPTFLRVIQFSEALADQLLTDDDWEVWEEICEKARDVADESDLALQNTAGYVFAGLRND